MTPDNVHRARERRNAKRSYAYGWLETVLEGKASAPSPSFSEDRVNATVKVKVGKGGEVGAPEIAATVKRGALVPRRIVGYIRLALGDTSVPGEGETVTALDVIEARR